MNTDVYEENNKINPLEYLNKKCSARAMICVESILFGDKATLQIKIYEVEVSEEKNPRVHLKRDFLVRDLKE